MSTVLSGGELNLHGEALGQFSLYSSSQAKKLQINYASGTNPIVIRGLKGSGPEGHMQKPGTDREIDIPDPETGVLISYQGSVLLQWNWIA